MKRKRRQEESWRSKQGPTPFSTGRWDQNTWAKERDLLLDDKERTWHTVPQYSAQRTSAHKVHRRAGPKIDYGDQRGAGNWARTATVDTKLGQLTAVVSFFGKSTEARAEAWCSLQNPQGFDRDSQEMDPLIGRLPSECKEQAKVR